MLRYSFLIFILHFQSIEQIPVLMWEANQELNSSNKFSSLEFETHDFKTILSKAAKRKIPIVVFLEDTLSLEDLIIRNEYGNTIFTALSSFVEAFNSFFMPNVENPFEVIEQITNPIKIIDLDSFNDWPQMGTLVFNLKNIKTNDSRKNMLKKHDLTIFKIQSEMLVTHNHILGIFTARYPSWIIPEYSERHNFKKLLQSEPSSESPPESKIVPIVDDKNLLLVVSGNADYSKDNGKIFSSVTLSQSDFSIKDNEISLSLDGGSVKVVFSISFGKDGFWRIDNITMDEKSVKYEEIEIPMNFSYHCSKFELYNKATKQILKIPGFQIQPFKEEQEQQQFGAAFDCVGFVTIPICSGIFVIAILLIILFCGIIAMMDIETPDRFDDPNGKVFKAFVEYY
ncbi:V-type proton ATPase subunit S1-like [Coccinella septempunctata]|uniref:V-type proton ATPase subunit S1-like n=1 Tax=Coccinella septempunctata TaxID=41139 RepID=UPI001D06C306|nr:V-type proton ATPase subunit S1-like [Coccinella septempunctata]